MSGFSLHAWIGLGSLYQAPKYPSLPLTTTSCGPEDDYISYNNGTMNFDSINGTISNTAMPNYEDR